MCSGSGLSFNCRTSGAFLEWNVTEIQLNGTTLTRRLETDRMNNYINEPLLTPSHTFYVTNIESNSALTSMLYTNNLTANVTISCGTLPRNITNSSSIATIHVISQVEPSKFIGHACHSNSNMHLHTNNMLFQILLSCIAPTFQIMVEMTYR